MLLVACIGLALRVILLWQSENRPDCDEATVGLMALDILEGREFPFFFYGSVYSGGGALEAYLAAAGFALAGPSVVALKGGVLLMWMATAGALHRLLPALCPARYGPISWRTGCGA